LQRALKCVIKNQLNLFCKQTERSERKKIKMATQKYLISEENTGSISVLSAEGRCSCVLENREHQNGLKRRIEEMEKKVFGYELVMDLSDCDLSGMSSKKKLTEYVNRLCKLIKMKKYGKAQLPYFGLEKPQTKGYSLLQFIETSSITGHFSEYWRKSYINIFSCKPYDHRLAANFTKEFFGSKHAKMRFLVR